MAELAGTTRVSFLKRLGDRDDALSWNEFHERYGELLFRYARRRGASWDEAEDIVQEVEMSLFRAMEEFQYDPARGRFRSYLRIAVIHAMGRRAAKSPRREAGLDPHALADLVEDDEPLDQRWENEWRLHRFRRAFRELAREFEPVTLEAFRLHVLADRSVEQTAEHLRLSKASVYQAKSRVLRRLKERIDEMDPDDDS